MSIGRRGVPVTDVWYRRKQGKGSRPGKAGRALPLSIRQGVNAGTLSLKDAQELALTGGVRPSATLHHWLGLEEWSTDA